MKHKKHIIFQNKGNGWNYDYRYMFWCPIKLGKDYICKPKSDTRSKTELITYMIVYRDTLIVRGEADGYNSNQ